MNKKKVSVIIILETIFTIVFGINMYLCLKKEDPEVENK